MSSRLLQPTTDIFNHAKDLKKAATTVAGDLHAEAVNQFAGFKDAASNHLSNVRGQAGDSWQTVKGFIKQHPFTAVGIGVAAGLILTSAALSRRD